MSDTVLPLTDGRGLGCIEFGDRHGTPILMLHGTPGSRLMFRPAEQAARRLGLRLICPDRPGIGLSTWHEARTLATVAEDMEQLLVALGIERCCLLGVSGGAPYAVATAERLGDRVAHLALVSPMGPVVERASQLMLSLPHRLLFRGLAQRPIVARGFAEAIAAQFRVAPRSLNALLGRLLGEPDRSILARPAIIEHVIGDVGEAIRQGVRGVVRDLELFGQPWGIELSQVEVPATLWQGEMDRLVPKEAAFELGRALPRATVIRLADAGHFWIYDNIEPVLYSLVNRSTMQSAPAAGRGV